jgi:uncharacterized protein (DUF58 family)
MYVLVTLLVAIGAVNSQNNLLFLAFAVSIGAGVASGLLSGAMLMGVTVERSLPASASAGLPATIRYTVRNRHRFLPVFAIAVEEASRERGRGFAGATWRALMPGPRAAVLHLTAGECAEIPAMVTPRRRGVATFAGITFSSAFPFGLMRKSVTVAAPGTLVITPRVERLRREAASNLMSRAESGLTSAPVLGRGDEFYGVRDYVPGDSPRLISWRATARTGSLVVREHTAPTAGCLWIVLNPNAPAGPIDDPTSDPVEQAIVLVASLVDAAIVAGVEVGFAAPDLGVMTSPGTAPRQRAAIMTALATLDAATKSPRPAETLASFERAVRRSACIVVHAGGVDPSVGPGGARHLSASDLARLTMTGGRAAKEPAA